MLRYSLASLAAVIVCLSIYAAALAQGDGLWPQISVTMTLSILLFATLAAVFSRSRTFAIGFSIVGWLYFAISFLGFTGGVRENLLTQSAINWLYGQVHMTGQPTTLQLAYQPYAQPGAVAVPSTSFAPRPITEYALQPITASTGVRQTLALVGTPAAPTPAFVNPHHFAQIGHGLWAVLIGAMGGVVAQVMYARSQRKKTNGDLRRHTSPTN